MEGVWRGYGGGMEMDREGPRGQLLTNFLGRCFDHNSCLQASLGAAIFFQVALVELYPGEQNRTFRDDISGYLWRFKVMDVYSTQSTVHSTEYTDGAHSAVLSARTTHSTHRGFSILTHFPYFFHTRSYVAILCQNFF